MPKKKLIFALLILVIPFCLGQASEPVFSPTTIAEMTTNISLSATIYFTGTPSSSDWMEARFLTFSDWENQTVESIQEEIRIQNQVFRPAYETKNKNKYAVFTIENLGRFGTNPKFELRVNARIKTTSRLGLNQDFDLNSTLRENLEYLKPTQFIESDSAELKSKAALEFQSNSEIETIRQITEWVNQNIQYDFENYYGEMFSAVQTYHNKKGVCDEFANLTAAFLRIKGIPTQYVMGISFDGKRFGNHGWLEAFLPKTGWIGADSTYGEAGFVDAAHIIQGKGIDASAIKNLVVELHAQENNPLEIRSELQEPQIEIVETKNFEPIIALRVETPEKLELDQPFQISATLSNSLKKEILIPLSLHLHPAFELENKTRIVWLKPLEQKKIVWNIISPSTGESGYYATYDWALETPDQKKEGKLVVYPDLYPPTNAQPLEITDISPFISNQNLEVEITIQNPFSEAKNISATLSQGEKKETVEKNIPKKSQETVRLKLENIELGEAKLEISGALRQTHSISIPKPENKEQEPLIPPEPNPSPSEPHSIQEPEPSFFEQILNAIAEWWNSLFG